MTASANFFRTLGWLALAGLALLVMLGDGHIDLAVEDFFFDPVRSEFLWNNNPLVDRYLYQGAKWMASLLALGLIAWGIIAARMGTSGFTWRHLTVGILGSILIPVLAQVIKSLTGVECPWSVDRYGGTEMYQSLVEMMSHGAGNGHCFPAGHSSGGFYLFAWAMAWMGVVPRIGKILGAAGLVLGLLLGLTRMAQGAHFLSHVLWAGWFAMLFSALLHEAVLGRKGRSSLAITLTPVIRSVPQDPRISPK